MQGLGGVTERPPGHLTLARWSDIITSLPYGSCDDRDGHRAIRMPLGAPPPIDPTLGTRVGVATLCHESACVVCTAFHRIVKRALVRWPGGPRRKPLRHRTFR